MAHKFVYNLHGFTSVPHQALVQDSKTSIHRDLIWIKVDLASGSGWKNAFCTFWALYSRELRVGLQLSLVCLLSQSSNTNSVSNVIVPTFQAFQTPCSCMLEHVSVESKVHVNWFTLHRVANRSVLFRVLTTARCTPFVKKEDLKVTESLSLKTEVQSTGSQRNICHCLAKEQRELGLDTSKLCIHWMDFKAASSPSKPCSWNCDVFL